MTTPMSPAHVLTPDSPEVHTVQTLLRDKCAVVSGGTSGIGRAISALLAAQGARLVVFGRDDDDLRATIHQLARTEGEVFGVCADLTKPEDVRRVFAEADRRLGGIDILINNAGIEAGAVTEGDEEAWRYKLATDLTGHLDCTRHAVERMRRRGGGHIINIGSISAVHVNEGVSLYVAAKAGLAGFSRSLRKELGPHHIKVSLIEPGLVGTDLLDGSDADPETQRAEQEKGAMLKPEDIAVAVHFCLSQPPRSTISRLQIQPRQDE